MTSPRPQKKAKPFPAARSQASLAPIGSEAPPFPKWILVAQAELGQAEIPGAADNPRIREYHASTLGGAEPDEVPWCSSFVHWCLKQAGITGTGQKNARSWLSWGEQPETPALGDIAVFEDPARGQKSGHVGFFLGEASAGMLRILGGNQGDQVSVRSFPRAKLLAIRRVPAHQPHSARPTASLSGLDPWLRAPVSVAAGLPRILNVSPDVRDFRDRAYMPSLASLPGIMYAPMRAEDVLDQGDEGACTGFALAALVNRHYRSKDEATRVSPRFLYEVAKRYDEWEGAEYEGSSLRGALKGFFKHGACLESVLPYQVGQRFGRIPDNAYEEARGRSLGAYFRVDGDSISDLQNAVFTAGAVYASANAHRGWFDDLRDVEGCCEIPWAARDYEAEGGHAFLIIGYDARGFLIQNSWGTRWGQEGLARLTYADWLANRTDAWVAQLGAGPLPPAVSRGSAAKSVARARSVNEHDIAGHYIAIEEGVFDRRGPFQTDPGADIPAMVERICAPVPGGPGGPRKVLLFAHGGVVSEGAAAAKTLDLLQTLMPKGIYPVHLIWHTGILECVEALMPWHQRPQGPAGFGLWDLTDEGFEFALRPLGRQVWREMKRRAKNAVWTESGNDGPAVELIKALDPEKVELHLAAHSAGSILMSHLVEWCALNKRKVKTLTFFAPAVDTHTFLALAGTRIGPSATVDSLAIHLMPDGDERSDDVALAYRKSLLYLVSESFEEDVPMPLLGLERSLSKDMKGRDRWVDPAIRDWLRASSSFASVRAARPEKTSQNLHASMDEDPRNVDAMVERILATEPR